MKIVSGIMVAVAFVVAAFFLAKSLRSAHLPTGKAEVLDS